MHVNLLVVGQLRGDLAIANQTKDSAVLDLSNPTRSIVNRYLGQFFLGTACLSILLMGGCASLRKKPIDPSHQLRTEASGSMPGGLDDRARQIESNLGVR